MNIELKLIHANQEAIKQLGKDVKILYNNIEILKKIIDDMQRHLLMGEKQNEKRTTESARL